MKKSTYFIALLLLFSTVISCKKETKISTKGYWTGTLSDDGSSTTGFIGILHKDNNIARVFISLGTTDTTVAISGNGTYTIDADSVRTTVVFGSSTLKFNGKLNNTSNVMVGRYANITNPITGNFSVTKN